MEKTVKNLSCSGDAKRIIDKIDKSKLLSLDIKNCSRLDLFLFAMALGIDSGIETDLSKIDSLVRGEYIKTKYEAYLYAAFIGDIDNTDDLELLNDVGNIYSKAQKYANTGFMLIDSYFEKAEEVVKLELLQGLDQAYNSIAEDLD